MAFLRHVGKHGDRKVAVVFREVPGETHMCLVTYTETLNQHIHDPMMQCIESDIGQNSENLADALNRTFTKDGRPILTYLHMEGLLKKVNTELVIMTPAPNTRIKLNELNSILDEMKQGESAVRRLAELDASTGLQDPADVARRLRGDPTATSIPSTPDGILGDTTLAKQRLDQAQRMEREAKGLLAEAQRLIEEAKAMDPGVAPVATPAPKARKTKAKVSV